MGLTIYSKNCNCDLGVGGFVRLRRAVASLCPDEIRDHYDFLMDNYYDIVSSEETGAAYDAKTEALYKKYEKTHGKVIAFLYASDISAKFSYGVAKQLLDIIKDYDDSHIYGYAGWGDKAMRFRDFKQILEDAAETKSQWGWR